MRYVTRSLALVFAVSAGVVAGGTQAGNPIDRIREADLKADMFALASDTMRGREAGTLDEMAASVWVAERAREIGLQPAGDNGTFFQFFPIDRFRVSASNRIGYAMMEAAVALPLALDIVNPVVVENCFPSGALRVWARDLCDRGFASIMTATSPPRAPHPSGGDPVVGTTPLCVAVPDPFGNHVIADMALTEATFGDVLRGDADETDIRFHSVGMWALAVALETMVRSMTTASNSVLFLAWQPTFKAAVEETSKRMDPWRMPGQTKGGGL